MYLCVTKYKRWHSTEKMKLTVESILDLQNKKETTPAQF